MPASLSTTSSRNTGNKERSDWKLTAYPVMEHFYTIQGEGAHAGQAAYFIRLAGCDVG